MKQPTQCTGRDHMLINNTALTEHNTVKLIHLLVLCDSASLALAVS
jgi:hypothetical protein